MRREGKGGGENEEERRSSGCVRWRMSRFSIQVYETNDLVVFLGFDLGHGVCIYP